MQITREQFSFIIQNKDFLIPLGLDGFHMPGLEQGEIENNKDHHEYFLNAIKALEFFHHCNLPMGENSYQAKHQAEEFGKAIQEFGYIPNGIFILAAYHFGHSIKQQTKPCKRRHAIITYKKGRKLL